MTNVNSAEAATPAYLSPAWFEQRIVLQQTLVDGALAQVTATEMYQAYMREVGALNMLKQQQAELLKQATGKSEE